MFKDYYELMNQDPIGRGANGVVFKCRRKSDKLIVALKIIKANDEEHY